MPLDYVLKRVGFFLIIVWLAATLNFFIPRMMPGSPEEALGQRLSKGGAVVTPEQLRTVLAEFGFVLAGGEDPRLFPLYLGYPNLVRGYDVHSFSASDCGPNAVSSCPLFEDLLGSRLLVGNLELRFPLLRPFTGASRNMYGPLPVEVAFFADAGLAFEQQRPLEIAHQQQRRRGRRVAAEHRLQPDALRLVRGRARAVGDRAQAAPWRSSGRALGWQDASTQGTRTRGRGVRRASAPASRGPGHGRRRSADGGRARGSGVEQAR